MKVFESFLEIYEHQKMPSGFKKLIPNSVHQIAKEFFKNNKKLYVVGGAVRDFLMKRNPKDFDLATDALPEQTEKILKKLNFKILEVGKQFGIVIAVDQSGEEFEIATFRADIGGSRRPDAVEFTNIETDVKRRDLTINALFYDIEKNEIVDLVGGKSDIETGTIKTVGDPKQRFEEDALRKLRAIRFYARAGKKIDKDLENALYDTSLENVSNERIYDEFQKGLKQAKHPRVFLETLHKFGYLEHVFPNLKLKTKFIDSNNATIQAAYVCQNNPVTKIESELNNAKWSNDEISDIKWLINSSKMNQDDVYTLMRKLEQEISLSKSDIMSWGRYFDANWYSKLLDFDLSTINKAQIAKNTPNKSQINSAINKEILKNW